MGLQAIDQTAFPEVLGKTKVFYLPEAIGQGYRTLWSFPISRESGLYKVDSFNFLLVHNYIVIL